MLKRTDSLRRFFEYPQHMFRLRNKISSEYVLLYIGMTISFKAVSCEQCNRNRVLVRLNDIILKIEKSLKKL